MNTRPKNDDELRLFLSFFDDASASTQELVQAQLKNMLAAEPWLKGRLEYLADATLRLRLQNLFEDWRLNELRDEICQLFSSGKNLNLEEGCWLLARLAYPDLQRIEISKPLDDMAEDIEERIDFEDASPEGAMDILRRSLFVEMGFHGDDQKFYDPDNSFLNRVLERKVGIPISLSCIYLLVAWRLDLPAYGVGLPGHFIVAHRLQEGSVYLDPFDGGRILSRRDCQTIVRRTGLTFTEEHLLPATHDQILIRMMVNLVNIYTDREDRHMAGFLTRLLQELQTA